MKWLDRHELGVVNTPRTFLALFFSMTQEALCKSDRLTSIRM